MKLSKSQWLSNGYSIFSTLFIVFALMSIANSYSYIRLSRLGLVSIAPENLKSAPESFSLRLKVESFDFPVEEMVKSKSWGELQSDVSAYAQRLELIENENRLRSIIVMCLYLLSTIGMALFAYQRKQQKYKDAQPSTQI